VAHSQAHSGLTLARVVLSPLLPKFHNRIMFYCSGVSPTLVFLYTFMHNMWRQNTYPKIEIESR